MMSAFKMVSLLFVTFLSVSSFAASAPQTVQASFTQTILDNSKKIDAFLSRNQLNKKISDVKVLDSENTSDSTLIANDYFICGQSIANPTLYVTLQIHVDYTGVDGEYTPHYSGFKQFKGDLCSH